MGLSLKGCQIVAGGRSVAQTTGKQRAVSCTLEGCHGFLAPVPGAESISFPSGGLRYASTTGYYLTALQADISPLMVDFLFAATLSYQASIGFITRESKFARRFL